MMSEEYVIPEKYQRDVERAVSILKEGGCTAVFLFGSVARGTMCNESDIDVAVEGCPKEKVFHLYGTLFRELDHMVDLVDLDIVNPFTRYLKTEEILVRVG